MPSPTSRQYVDEATSGLQSLVRAQQLAQERQAKSLLRLAKQAEAGSEAHAAWQEKQARRERRQAEHESQKIREQRLRSEQSHMVSIWAVGLVGSTWYCTTAAELPEEFGLRVP